MLANFRTITKRYKTLGIAGINPCRRTNNNRIAQCNSASINKLNIEPYVNTPLHTHNSNDYFLS